MMKIRIQAADLVLVAFCCALVACSGGQTFPDRVDSYDGNGGGDVKLCTKDQDCPDGQTCQDGVCAVVGACNCNYDCDKAAGQVCDPVSHRCAAGAPPINCQSDCDCFSGESCIGGSCKPMGGDTTSCTNDNDCPSGQACVSNRCVPKNCSKREDCAGAVCLICVQNECVAPPPICQGVNDCCVGYFCNFGTCVPEHTGCQSDSDCQRCGFTTAGKCSDNTDCTTNNDCEDTAYPRCKDSNCIQQCINDIDCPLPGQICQNTHCITPGCTPEACAVGQWCNTGSGQCEPGCDANSDCTPPYTCNYITHQCGQTDCCGGCQSGSYCDTLTCQCVENCGPTKPCPTGFECRQDGRCWCTEGACPTGSHCNTTTGQCEQDTVQCNFDTDCPSGWVCNQTTHTCEISQGGGVDGDPCFQDANCNSAAGFLCDSSILCLFCALNDPNFNPTFTCRKECSLITGGPCPAGYDCLYRHVGLKGLCMPP